eukprot:gnl/TRDRNA2_/TRDRNA2_210330_c0_seq1.p3 gnl/TRDRNA2_/TRDRNA2_210330_c0~~gnl/TRDRNA2_/TRDRNA2_210330_c0_seq1.p3  ORF type:complete len:121 (+),score=10.99 gnl/TRDRNA2_/TRDRNA2_210330_c0_seq1:340-702(+)
MSWAYHGRADRKATRKRFADHGKCGTGPSHINGSATSVGRAELVVCIRAALAHFTANGFALDTGAEETSLVQCLTFRSVVDCCAMAVGHCGTNFVWFDKAQVALKSFGWKDAGWERKRYG